LLLELSGPELDKYRDYDVKDDSDEDDKIHFDFVLPKEEED
jgi:hypothetical protein